MCQTAANQPEIQLTRHSPEPGIVAEQVRVNQVFDAGPASCSAAQCTDGIVVQRLIPTLFRREQPVSRLAPAVVDPQPLQKRWGQRDVPCNTNLSFAYMQHHLLAVKRSAVA